MKSGSGKIAETMVLHTRSGQRAKTEAIYEWLYATCAFAGAGVYWGLLECGGFAESYALLGRLFVIVATRLAAVKWNWCFPGIRDPGGSSVP